MALSAGNVIRDVCDECVRPIQSRFGFHNSNPGTSAPNIMKKRPFKAYQPHKPRVCKHCGHTLLEDELYTNLNGRWYCPECPEFTANLAAEKLLHGDDDHWQTIRYQSRYYQGRRLH